MTCMSDDMGYRRECRDVDVDVNEANQRKRRELVAFTTSNNPVNRLMARSETRSDVFVVFRNRHKTFPVYAATT